MLRVRSFLILWLHLLLLLVRIVESIILLDLLLHLHTEVLHHRVLLHRHLLSSHRHLLSSHRHLLSAHRHLLSTHRHLLSAHRHLLSSHRHLLARQLHELLLPLQHIAEPRVIKLVQYDLEVVLKNSVPLHKVLNLIQVHSHLASLVQEFLLCRDEVLRNHLLTCTDSHRQLFLDHLPLLLGPGVRHDVVLSEVVEELAGDLIECLFSKQVRVMLEFIEWDELDDVCRHVLPVS